MRFVMGIAAVECRMPLIGPSRDARTRLHTRELANLQQVAAYASRFARSSARGW
jgi:hypothetical protein